MSQNLKKNQIFNLSIENTMVSTDLENHVYTLNDKKKVNGVI